MEKHVCKQTEKRSTSYMEDSHLFITRQLSEALVSKDACQGTYTG